MPDSKQRRDSLSCLRHHVKKALGVQRGQSNRGLEGFFLDRARVAHGLLSAAERTGLAVGVVPEWITEDVILSGARPQPAEAEPAEPEDPPQAAAELAEPAEEPREPLLAGNRRRRESARAADLFMVEHKDLLLEEATNSNRRWALKVQRFTR